ncbi:hypothetical protein [Neglectibacter timonensis]|uniref:Uncharacterized protein n=1 Tax=Neglectibacter timonensis TaxID=1776382 RepID=A0ABT1RYX7_9FIRM|nr:hypothetical protein [Neglectibacter timonensis]MCQ4839898.1 hypothetical protein [Neglectibacter timonensis]MCQ4843641.1 hypothetical protein [Neglectibacter timonensis]
MASAPAHAYHLFRRVRPADSLGGAAVPFWHTMEMVAMNYPITWPVTARPSLVC